MAKSDNKILFTTWNTVLWDVHIQQDTTNQNSVKLTKIVFFFQALPVLFVQALFLITRFYYLTIAISVLSCSPRARRFLWTQITTLMWGGATEKETAGRAGWFCLVGFQLLVVSKAGPRGASLPFIRLGNIWKHLPVESACASMCACLPGVFAWNCYSCVKINLALQKDKSRKLTGDLPNGCLGFDIIGSEQIPAEHQQLVYSQTPPHYSWKGGPPQGWM